MALSQRDVRNRIDAVKNIQKITRAMEMVAAARLRRAEQRIEALRPYADAIRQVARVSLEFRENGAPPAKGAAVRSTNEFDLALEVPLAQTGAHRKRLEKEKEQLDKVIANSRRQPKRSTSW